MKGSIFVAFCKMVEERFSAEMMDDIIVETNPPSGGAYTTVGNYSHDEIMNYVHAMSARTGMTPPALVRAFGFYLFEYLAAGHRQLVDEASGAIPFLYDLERRIHAQVRKLYPDAALPRFVCDLDSRGRLIMHYRSERPMADLAEGLIEAAISHFGETITVERDDVPGEESFAARFVLTPQ